MFGHPVLVTNWRPPVYKHMLFARAAAQKTTSPAAPFFAPTTCSDAILSACVKLVSGKMGAQNSLTMLSAEIPSGIWDGKVYRVFIYF